MVSLLSPSMSTVTPDPLTFANLLKTLDVTNALHEILSPLIKLSIAKALKPVQQSFDAKFQQLTASTNVLNYNSQPVKSSFLI